MREYKIGYTGINFIKAIDSYLIPENEVFEMGNSGESVCVKKKEVFFHNSDIRVPLSRILNNIFIKKSRPSHFHKNIVRASCTENLQIANGIKVLVVAEIKDNITRVTIEELYGKLKGLGLAKCRQGDIFNEEVGLELAKVRALKDFLTKYENSLF